MKRRMSTPNLQHFRTVLHHDCCLGLTQICVSLCAWNKIFMVLHVCVSSPDSRAKTWASSSNPDPLTLEIVELTRSLLCCVCTEKAQGGL